MNPLFIKRLGVGITFLLVIVLGIQLAWWGWHFFGARVAVQEPVIEAIDPAIARNLFGEAGTASVTSSAPAENNSGIRLKGVYAVDGKTLSAAVVNIGGRDTSVRLNEKISDNVTLVEVGIEHIVVSRAGLREKLRSTAVSANRPAWRRTTIAGHPPPRFA